MYVSIIIPKTNLKKMGLRERDETFTQETDSLYIFQYKLTESQYLKDFVSNELTVLLSETIIGKYKKKRNIPITNLPTWLYQNLARIVLNHDNDNHLEILISIVSIGIYDVYDLASFFYHAKQSYLSHEKLIELYSIACKNERLHEFFLGGLIEY